MAERALGLNVLCFLCILFQNLEPDFGRVWRYAIDNLLGIGVSGWIILFFFFFLCFQTHGIVVHIEAHNRLYDWSIEVTAATYNYLA